MLPGSDKNTQKGYVAAVVVIFMLLIAAFLYPWKFPSFSDACPEKPTEEESAESELTYPAIQEKEGSGPDLNVPPKKYKLTRKNVKVNKYVDGGTSGTEYFQASSQHTVFYEQKTINDKNYLVYFPGTFGEIDVENGFGDRVLDGKDQIIVRAQRMLYFVLADENWQPKVFTGKDQLGKDFDYLLVDFYKLVDGPSYTLKDGALCSRPQRIVKVPIQSTSENRDQLQLEWFLFGESYGFNAHCKPAIYLYPPSKLLVNVKVYPKGELSYTDPPYDPGKGWVVAANPNGDLYQATSHEPRAISKYDYLYYESKLLDSEIKRSLPADAGKKPTEGWSVKFDELESLYNKILPKLGLNEKEKNDFKEYWLKTLPESQYYFVGLVGKNQRDYLEPLVVTPSPDTSIRFSLYFEPIDAPRIVQEPEIKTPQRRGFTLVDWGGMVKLNSGTPFTCSQ